LSVNQLVEEQLNLQVKISYGDHYDFLLRHGLNECARVLDIGTGNGSFVARLAQDHSEIQFVGIDKRPYCIESAQKNASTNLDFQLVDMFSRTSSLDFSVFDGFLMRYFILHVDNSQKILELLRVKSKRPSRFWIIDLDWSQFNCVPESEGFHKLTKLVMDFCAKISVESSGGQNVLPILKKLEYQNIVVEHLPFTSRKIPLDDLALYLKQEVLCYSRMLGRGETDPETQEIVKFIDGDLKVGKFEITYGMILISGELF
jgi:ubiquinone/menaquinone biosynthesis C-methylase UbiE